MVFKQMKKLIMLFSALLLGLFIVGLKGNNKKVYFQPIPWYKRSPEAIKKEMGLSLSIEEIKKISDELSKLSPEEVVKLYCDLDYNGGRSGQESDVIHCKMWFLVNWFEEPGWDTGVIIDGYEIKDKSIKTTTATISVVYRVIGIFSGDEILMLGPFYQLVNFQLIKSNKGWKINQPIISPHISRESEIKIQEYWLSITKDEKEKEKRKTNIETLKTLLKFDEKYQL
jgi:hypothetical protein